jgi:Flp pilus assembly protein TadD
LSGFVEDKDRKVIPRWRNFRKTVAAGELGLPSTQVPGAIDDSAFSEKISDWNVQRTLPYAAEVVGAAIVLQRHADATEAAEFVLRSNSGASAASRRLALQIIHPSENQQFGGDEVAYSCHEIRRSLQVEPRNAIAWTDLALHYANVGALDRAMRAMTVAMKLAPENRFVLRSAARLYVHKSDPEAAHALLLNAAATGSDPWLTAAEIAVSSMIGKTSSQIRSGRRLLAGRDYRPHELSELASSIATVEMRSASERSARKLFRQSLLDPTENSVAQARWAGQQVGGLDLDSGALRRSPEASAWSSFHNGEWDQALANSRAWLDDQQFSSRPAMLGSYVAGVALEDFRESARLARAGLLANPQEPGLLNNLAYALVNLGQLAEAEKLISAMRPRSPSEEIVRLATSGLLNYRKRNVAAGRLLYQQALDKAERANLTRLRAKAAVFFALEEIRANPASAGDATSLALRYTRNLLDADLSNLLRKLKEPPSLKPRSRKP